MKKESAVIRIMVLDELRDAMEQHYSPLYTKQWSDGLKADLYHRFGIEAPKPPSDLDIKMEQMRKLQAEVERLQEIQKERESHRPQSITDDKQDDKQDTPAKPVSTESSENTDDKDKKTPAKSDAKAPAKAPAKQAPSKK